MVNLVLLSPSGAIYIRVYVYVESNKHLNCVRARFAALAIYATIRSGKEWMCACFGVLYLEHEQIACTVCKLSQRTQIKYYVLRRSNQRSAYQSYGGADADLGDDDG